MPKSGKFKFNVEYTPEEFEEISKKHVTMTFSVKQKTVFQSLEKMINSQKGSKKEEEILYRDDQGVLQTRIETQFSDDTMESACAGLSATHEDYPVKFFYVQDKDHYKIGIMCTRENAVGQTFTPDQIKMLNNLQYVQDEIESHKDLIEERERCRLSVAALAQMEQRKRDIIDEKWSIQQDKQPDETALVDLAAELQSLNAEIKVMLADPDIQRNLKRIKELNAMLELVDINRAWAESDDVHLKLLSLRANDLSNRSNVLDVMNVYAEFSNLFSSKTKAGHVDFTLTIPVHDTSDPSAWWQTGEGVAGLAVTSNMNEHDRDALETGNTTGSRVPIVNVRVDDNRAREIRAATGQLRNTQQDPSFTPMKAQQDAQQVPQKQRVEDDSLVHTPPRSKT